ncbi:MAG: flavodoxin family protein [Burkholderiales bacterium]|jgi:multimeric flavodoxin WrbA
MSSATRPKRLTLVWWSNTGGTQALVSAAQAGARQTLDEAELEMEIQVLRCDQASARVVEQSDALILACPECLGSVAGPMKTFLDQCYYPLLGRIEGRAWSAMVCAGTDGEGALRLLRRVAAGWRLRETVPAVVVRSGDQATEAILGPTNLTQADLSRARTLGATLAAGLAVGLW